MFNLHEFNVGDAYEGVFHNMLVEKR